MSAQKRFYHRSTLAGKRPSLLMALEPRMLYDGAGAEVVADAAAAEALVPQDSSAAQETASPENGAASQPAAEPADAGAQETAAGEGQGSSDDAAAAPAVSGQEEAGSAAGTSPAAATNGNSAANTTAASHDAGAASPDAGDEETAAAATEATATGSADHDDQSGAEADTAEPLAGLEGQSIRQVVFVDSAVRDHQTLVNGISGGSEAGPAGKVGTSGYSLSGSTLVVTLGEKPLDDMHAVLEHCHDLDAVHLVSHGSEGELMLGGNRINAGNLGEHAGLFERLGKSLSADGDLLLYGCKVGKDGAGQAFIDQVAALSGADVNASTDDTGNASSGGNWNLEVATGPIETAALLNEQNAGNWQGTLAPVTINGQDLLRHMTYDGINGSAAAVGPDTFRLTEDAQSRTGSAMSNILIDLKENFELKFNARFSNRPNDQYGADGIAFVLHKDPRGLHATGQDGKGIGAQGIQKGLAVEFDTFWNRDNNGVSQEGDPSVSDPSPGDHTSVWDTDDPNSATKYLNVQSGASSAHIQTLPDLEDGQWHAVTMSWNAASKTLTYTVDGKTMSVQIEPTTYFGGTEVYFGFTAATGLYHNEHSVQLVSLKGTLVNKEPVAHADTVTAQAGKTVQVDVVQNDTDADPGDQAALHVTAIYDERDSATAIPINPGQTITLSSGTRVTLEHDGKLSVVMAQGTNDQEAFYYEVTDDKGGISKTAVHLQRDSDGDGVANVDDIDDDNDGILDANEGHKCVVKESFETPKSQNVHNNWYPGGTSLNGFETDGAGFNVIAVGDGSPGETLHYNYSGPDVAQDGLQYLDLGGTGTLSKTFTLSEQSLVDVSGWFSRRELASGTVKIDILDSGNNVVFSTTTVDLAGASRNTWYLSQAYGQSLAAGTYTLRIQLPNNLNVDNIRVCASRDSDGDGKADHLDIDSDNDGITDNVEAQATKGYKPPSGQDVDHDGLDDAYDANLGGAAASQGLTPVDTDSDGTADVLDADSDNDGIADIAERADGQPTTLTSPADTDGDGLLDIFEAGDVNDGFDVNDKNWDNGQFNLGRVPALNPDGSNAVPLTDGQTYSRDLLFRDVNDPPVAVDDIVTTLEDTPVNGNVLDNDSDPDGDTPLIVGSASIDTNGDGTPDSLNLGTPTTLTNNAGVTIGTLLLRANGSYTFTPALNYSGPVPELSYTVKDPGGKTATAKLKIAITPVNDPPVANPDTATTPEDTPINNINVLGNDSDPDGDPLSVTSATVDPAKGTVSVNPDGTLNFVPAPNYNGPAVITYTISDGHGGTATSTLTVTVTPVNDPPVANPDVAMTPEDTPINNINVLGNDSDPDGDPLSVTSATVDPAKGTVSVNPDGTLNFVPAPNYNGPAVITYTISDGHGGTATSTLTVTVTPVNDPPVANPDVATTPEDTPINNINVLGNDSDPDGDPLSVTSATVDPAKGTVSVNPDGTLNFVPAPNYNGPAVITYTISDGHGGTATSTLTVTVTPVNDPPVANPDVAMTPEDTPINNINVLGNDGDPDGDPLSVTSATVDPAKGTVSVNPDGTLNFVPAPNYNGPAVITYTIDDGHGGTATSTLTVTVTPVNDPPVANPDVATTPEDTPINNINVLGNDSDPDGDPLSVTSATVDPAKGTVSVNPDGTLNFVPAPNYNGPAVITYTIDDGHGGTATSTLTVTVTPVNDPPVANPDVATTPEDTPINNINVLGNDSDPDGDPLSVTSATVDPAKGTVSVNPDGTLNFVPAPNYNGPAVITYNIDDGHGGTATSTLTVTVTPVNDPPVANPDVAMTPEDTPINNINVLGNDSDPDGDPLSVTSATVDPAKGTVSVNPDGTLNFVPAPNYNGPAVITYTIDDGHGGTATSTLTVTVTPVNDPPVANPDVATTPKNTPINNINVLGNDGDPDGDPLTVTGVSVDPAKGTVTVNPDGTLNFVPTPGFTGTAIITYTISDGHGGTATSTVTVSVQPPHGGTHRPSPAHPHVPAAPSAPSAPAPRPPFGSTGLHILYGSPDTGHGPGAGPWSGGQTAAGPEAAFTGTGAEGTETPRMLGLDTSLDFDHNGDQLVGTEISQYIHDTVNHTWERVERWYGTGTPGAELLRYDALGGAQDPFNGFHSPIESRMLEDLGRLLDNVVSGSALSGDGASGLLPVFAESRTLQNQLSRADLLGRDMDRLGRVLAGDK